MGDSTSMRALVQRVTRANVKVDDEIVGEIGPGMLVLLGIHTKDADTELDWMVEKLSRLRIFDDEEGKMNRSLLDVGGEALVVSQFTLYGDSRRGNRPSYIEAARPEHAEPLYERFVSALAERLGRSVPTGRFGADMRVELVGQGPVTLLIERAPGASEPG